MAGGPFERFEDPVMGLRAMMRLLLVYYRRYNLNTVRSILNRWAPPCENDTGAYQWDVAHRLGVRVDEVLNLEDPRVLKTIVKAIVLHENGHPPIGRNSNWYSDEIYDSALKLALS